MDINLSSKLIRYAPAEVQTVTYVVEYAEHNCWDVREIHEYIEAQLKSSRLIEIADIILESKNMATINAKPSGASAKIDSLPAEKSSTDSPATANQRTILGKGASSVKKEEVELEEEYIEEAEGSYGATPKAYSAARSTRMTAKRKPFLKKMLSRTNPANRTDAYDSPRKGMSDDDRERARAGSKHGVGTRQDHDYPSEGPGGKTKNPKKIRKQAALGEEYISEEESDRMNDERLMRGGMGAGRGTTHTAAAKAKSTQSKSAKPDKNTAMSALEIVKRATEAKYGKGSIMSSYEVEGENLDEAGEDPCWKGYKQVGMKTKNGKEVPNCVPVTEAWMWELVDELAEDFDLLTQEDLEDLIIEAVVDIEDDAQMLDEALDIFTSYDVQPLFEDYYAAAAAKSKENSQKPEVKAAVRKARVEKVKAAAKAVGSTLKSKADAIKSKASSAVSSAKDKASSAASSAKDKASSAASSAKSAASSAKRGLKSIGKRAVGAASRAAGHAVGEYQAARIKAKRDSMSKTKPQSKPAASSSKPESKDAETRRKGEELLDKIRSSGGQKKDSGSSGLSSGQRSSSTTTTTTTTTRSGGGGGSSKGSSSSGGSDKPSVLRRAASAVKRGVKKVVGVGARAVAKGAGYVAKRMGEETSWRDRLGFYEGN